MRSVAAPDERQLAALVLAIAVINAWNRLNVTTAHRPADPGAVRQRRAGTTAEPAGCAGLAKVKEKGPITQHESSSRMTE